MYICFFLEWSAPHVHNNTKRDSSETDYWTFLKRYCTTPCQLKIHSTKSILLGWLKFYFWAARRFWSVQCLWCPESIVSRIDGGQGRKVPPSFFLPAALYSLFIFLFSKEEFLSTEDLKRIPNIGLAKKFF